MKVKITINSEDRAVVIPMEYDKEQDSLELSNQIEIEPVPNKDEDITKDVVLNLTHLIISTLKGL